MILDEYKIARLRKVFWDMNIITSWIEKVRTYSHYNVGSTDIVQVAIM